MPGRSASGRGSLLSLTALAHLPTRVFTSLSPAARLRVAAHVNSDEAIRVSKAARAVPRSGGGCAVPGPLPRTGAAAMSSRQSGESQTAREVAPGQADGRGRVTRRGDAGASHPSGPQGEANPPDPAPGTPDSPAYGPCFGQNRALNEGFRGHRRVAGRLRRVVVARRCTQHHLRRVMVETPPRAGPSPPHGPARFSWSAGRLEPPAGTVRSAPVGGPRPQRG
jgi:hypothetical protein